MLHWLKRHNHIQLKIHSYFKKSQFLTTLFIINVEQLSLIGPIQPCGSSFTSLMPDGNGSTEQMCQKQQHEMWFNVKWF